MAVCKTVGIAYVGSNPTPATSKINRLSLGNSNCLPLGMTRRGPFRSGVRLARLCPSGYGWSLPIRSQLFPGSQVVRNTFRFASRTGIRLPTIYGHLHHRHRDRSAAVRRVRREVGKPYPHQEAVGEPVVEVRPVPHYDVELRRVI